jgi:hypothetical protein
VASGVREAPRLTRSRLREGYPASACERDEAEEEAPLTAMLIVPMAIAAMLAAAMRRVLSFLEVWSGVVV